MTTRTGRVVVTLAVLAVVASGCVGPWAREPGRGAHDDAVARLQEAVDGADGWVVVDVPILHEGGGRSTWWLAPCSGGDRAVTVTGYSGSDVADIPGSWFVDEDRTAPCHDPGPELTVDGRTFVVGTPVVDIGPGWVPLDGEDRLVLTDPTTGTRHEISASTGPVTVDRCDGTTSWTVDWFEHITFTRESCLDTLGALPDAVLDLLPDAHRDRSRSELTVTTGQTAAVVEVLSTFDGWSEAGLEVRTFDGVTAAAVWLGPCRRLPDGTAARTVVDLITSTTLTLHDQPCP